MTNTIPNVPRQLLERAWRALANSATGREIGAYLDADPCAPECAETCARASMCSTCSALLSAPSPAGVDGLETICVTQGGCNVSWTATKVLSPAGTALCRLSDATAIIDGLRGEVADLLSMLATVSKAGLRVRTERDQQAQRVGELEGLLREVHGWIDESARVYRHNSTSVMLYRIDAALSAGKDSDQ